MFLNFITDLPFRGPRIVIYSYNKCQRDALLLTSALIKYSTCLESSTVHHQESQ